MTKLSTIFGPLSPSNVVAREELIPTHGAQNSTLFRVGEEGVASFTNITGKVPTLLTSTVGVADRCNHQVM